MKTWTLNKINYPTGGFTVFDFEANQYFDGTINKKVGGLRIRKMSSYASVTDQPLIKYYQYGENEDGNGNLRTNLSLQYESKQKIFEYQAGNPPSFQYSYETRRYSSNLSGQLFPNEGSPVTYAFVTEYDDILPHNNGKTIYEFREASDGKITLFNSAKFFVQSKHWNRGQLSRKRVYGQDNKIKYKEENTWQVIGNGTTADLCGRLVQAQNIYQNARPNNATCYSPSNDFDPNQIYYFEYGTCKLVRSETYTYDDTDDTKFVYKKSETDFDPTYFQVKEQRDYTSDGDMDLQRFRYVTDLNNLSASHTGNALALYQMKQNNDVSTPVEVLGLHKNAADAEPLVLGGKLSNFQVLAFNAYNYVLTDNIHLLEIPASPSLFASSFTNANVNGAGSVINDSHYVPRLEFGNYDTYGQLLDYALVGDSPTAFTYNTTQKDAVFHSFVSSTTSNSGGTPALTTSFYYELPLLGIRQLSAPNGLNTHFEYDTFGRLKKIKDHDTNLTDWFNYAYAVSSSGCTPPDPPGISVTAYATCSATLTATGCAGTIIWSNGATGVSISVDTKNLLSYTATCTVSACTSSPSGSLTIPTLPGGWIAQQIGSPPVDGCVQEASGIWTIRGSGNTFNLTDNFNFAYKSHSGNAVIVARIASMSANAGGMRSGVMLRSSTSPTADYYQFFFDSGNQVLSLYEQNSSNGDNQLGHQATTIPSWIRLKKDGTTVSVWYSQATNPAWNNDADWTLYTNVTSSLFNGSYLLGILAYNNAYGSNSLINETQFTNVATYTF